MSCLYRCFAKAEVGEEEGEIQQLGFDSLYLILWEVVK